MLKTALLAESARKNSRRLTVAARLSAARSHGDRATAVGGFARNDHTTMATTRRLVVVVRRLIIVSSNSQHPRALVGDARTSSKNWAHSGLRDL